MTGGTEAMDPTGRVEKLNQAVRGLVTLALTAGFLYGFAADKIGAEAYIGIFGGIIGFWFANYRQGQRASDAPAPANGGAKP